ncbi:SLBB domain-containing protein [Candidatus Poribacteria bacterium]
MVKKMRSLIVSFPRGNALIICAVLGLMSVLIASALGQSVDYVVGPGDVLYISVWGDQSMSGQVTVGPDGTIMLPQPIGSVYVSQMTSDEIAEELTKKMGEYVRQPVISVSIREFQGFVVHVIGQVNVPSFYTIPEGTTLQEAITQAGGFTELADPTSIIMYRKKNEGVEEDEGVEEQKIDFSQFLERNDMASNPILATDDIIVVPGIGMNERAKQVVTVFGEVAEPGPYDLDESMSVLDVLAQAGGVLRNADLRNIVIYNRVLEGKDAYRRVNIDVMSPESGDLATVMPTVSPGETIIIPSVTLLEEHAFSVNVAGQVVTPGAYPVVEGMRLMDALFLAGGFAEEASIDNIILISEEQDGSTTSLLSLRDYMAKGNMDANPVLHERDTIIVPMIETARSISPVQMAFSPSIAVSVIGEVTKPGVYQMPVESDLLGAITQAGGPTNDADLERTMVVHSGQPEAEQRLLIDLEEIMVEGNLGLLPVMSSGDIILVPKEEEKRDWWRAFMTGVRDLTVIATLIWYFVRIS